ncbi:MAG TPA: hypothetical protein IAB62_05330 [Candidatus Coprocola pullicola]|nr:hypothetical protein [Candidatus Coprocola pullicola]
MIETGARTPAAKKKETPEVSMAAGMGLAGMATGLLMKTILNEEKKSQTQSYINKLVQDYNKARQE